MKDSLNALFPLLVIDDVIRSSAFRLGLSINAESRSLDMLSDSSQPLVSEKQKEEKKKKKIKKKKWHII